MLTRLERTVLKTQGVKVLLQEGCVSFEKGGKTLEYRYNATLVAPSLEGDVVSFAALGNTKEHAMHLGTAISKTRSKIEGLVKPFKVELELKGTGFKAALKNEKGKNILVLTLGKSHDDYFVVPSDVTVTVPTATAIILESIDKEAVGQAQAKIRAFRKVDAYKGKGVLIKGQPVVLKEAKKKK